VAAARPWVNPSVLPGFGLTLGFAGTFLTLIVLIPIAALVVKAGSLPLAELWRVATEPRALASYRLSFGASLLAAAINAVFGLIIAWVAGALPLSGTLVSSMRWSICRLRCRRRFPASR
jgi:sulfate/thiosulfate transport system permease protein